MGDNCDNVDVTGNLPAVCMMRFNQIETALTTMGSDITHIRAILCGNGQPGIDELVRKLDECQIRQQDHITKLYSRTDSPVWDASKKVMVVVASLVGIIAVISKWVM